MRNIIAAGAALTAIISGVNACNDPSVTAVEIAGNYYCSEVTAITYKNVGGSGSYQATTNMADDGTCSQASTAYSGPMAPMDEEVSMHFRGPLQLKQFAVYTPSSGSTKKRSAQINHHRRHGHQQFHEHNKEIREIQDRAEEVHAEEKRADCADIVATIDGSVVSWPNPYPSCQSTPTAAVVNNAAANPTSVAASSTATGKLSSPAASPASTTTPSSASGSGTSSSGTGSWSRVAYYDSSSGTSNGLVFLNNLGGSGGSGTWSSAYGNSLSYASSDGTKGAASPQLLEDTTLPSTAEVIIMAEQECSNGDCGYTRPDTVAHHGFGGANKAFLMEFSMPDDGTSGWNLNMPAIWMLNANIPRTLQYGNADCSCWTSGCGEFDIFEVLNSGNTRGTSTFHMTNSGGDADYLARPTSGTIQLAVVFNGADQSAHIQVLSTTGAFASSLSSSDISGFCSNSGSVETLA
ncbi:MAG: target of Sbf [Pycnora praestabilis]|nr:MAG: target of Sbf [Pycnora praestabilis]